MKYGPILDNVPFNHGGLKGQTNTNLYTVGFVWELLVVVSMVRSQRKRSPEHAQRHPRSCQNIVFTVHADQVDIATLLCFDIEYRHRNNVDNTVRMKVGSTSFVSVVATTDYDVVRPSSTAFETTSKAC